MFVLCRSKEFPVYDQNVTNKFTILSPEKNVEYHVPKSDSVCAFLWRPGREAVFPGTLPTRIQ